MILVISPHGDDAELGMGGTIARLAAKGEEIVHLVMTTSAYNDRNGYRVGQTTRREEAEKAAEVLGIGEVIFTEFTDNHLAGVIPNMVRTIDELVEDRQPRAVYTCLPWFNEDHVAVYRATLASMRAVGRRTWLAYEMPMQHLGYQVPEHGWTYSEVTDEGLARKVSALSCYSSQGLSSKAGPVSTRGILNLAQMRGMECGCEYAERQLLLRGSMP